MKDGGVEGRVTETREKSVSRCRRIADRSIGGEGQHSRARAAKDKQEDCKGHVCLIQATQEGGQDILIKVGRTF